jgi:hypothetical protein
MVNPSSLSLVQDFIDPVNTASEGPTNGVWDCSGQASQLVEDEGAGNRHIERTAHSHHRYFDHLIEQRPDFRRQPRVLVTKKDDGSRPRLDELGQRGRVLVQLDANDLRTLTTLPLDPTELGAHPVQTGPKRKCVADLEGTAIVLRFRHGHARSHGVAASKQSAEVRLEGNPQRRHDQVIRARDRSSSPLGLLLRATVPPTH